MTRIVRVQRFLMSVAMVICILLLVALAVSHLFETSFLHAGATPESVTLVRDALIPNLIMTAGMIALLLIIFRLLKDERSMRVLVVLGAAGAAASILFLLGARTTQIYDFQYVIETAELFAKGNYKPLNVDYFHVYSYQLGFCLPMEVVLRIFPALDINRFMQAVNVVLNVASAGILSLLCTEITESGHMGRMTMAASLLFLPLFLFPVYVYGTIPMIFFSLCALLCFSRYLHTRKMIYGLLWPMMIAAAYMLKPNAAVPMVAIIICAVLDLMKSRDAKIFIYIVLSVVLSVLVIRLVIFQYEIRGGIKLSENISMLSRFVMGFKPDEYAAAGWYNGYTDKFLPLEITAQLEKEMARTDLREVLAIYAADPSLLAAFLREKLLTQWLEPTNGCLWYGNLTGQHGEFAQLAVPVYTQGSAVRVLLQGYMNVFQQAQYLLAALGAGSLLCCRNRKKDTVDLVLPLIFVGGILYHLLFEAKSSYSYVYLLLLLPLTAQGIAVLEQMICWMRKR